MGYFDLTTLRDRLTISDFSKDDLLAISGDWADGFIDGFTHRFFESRRETRFYGPEALDTSPDTISGSPYASRVLRQGSWHRLFLDMDLQTIYGVKNGDGTTIPIGGYWAEPRNETPQYSIWLKSDYAWTWDTDGWVEVDADWGYSVYPNPIISGCSYQLAEYHYRSRLTLAKPQPLWLSVTNRGNQLPEGFPSDVLVALEPFIRQSR